MITASKLLLQFIENQGNITEFAKRLTVAPGTVYNIIKGEDISSDVVAKIINRTGLKFDSAFEVKE